MPRVLLYAVPPLTRVALLLTATLATVQGQTAGYVIETIAGIGRPTGDNGPATAALLNTPAGIAIDRAGNVFFTEESAHRVRKIDAAGKITTIAGTGIRNYSGDGGAAVRASVLSPAAVAVDPSGNVYFSDIAANTIRKISPEGIITRIAGTGIASFSGDGGQATGASLNHPYALAFNAGYLYIADTDNYRVRRIAPTGIITTVVGTGVNAGTRLGGLGITSPVASPYGLVFDAIGNLYISEYGLDRVLKLDPALNLTLFAGSGEQGETGDGGSALLATLNGPSGLAMDSAGSVFVADQNGNRIRKIANGIITTVAGSGPPGFFGDGSIPLNAQFAYPFGLAFDPAGRLYICDPQNHRVRRIDFSTPVIITVAGGAGALGDNGAARDALLFTPAGAVLDGAGNFYFADSDHHRIRKITPAGVISTVAGNGTGGFSGDGGDARNAQLRNPQGLALDAAGNLVIADTNNNRIRRVNASGTIQTIAGSGVRSFSGDGGAAVLAGLNRPIGIAFDFQSGFYIADTDNNRIRRVNATGQISTFAGTNTPEVLGDNGLATSAGLSSPFAVAVDNAGNVYIADSFHNRVRKVAVTGIITTVAGNAAVLPSLDLPTALALDPAGNLYIADAFNGQVRQVSPAGVAVTLAGSGGLGFDGDGYSALLAQIAFPSGIAIDKNGAIYIADLDNHRIRKSTPVAVLPDFLFSVSAPAGGLKFSLTSIGDFAGTVALGAQSGSNLLAFNPVTLAAGSTVTVPVPPFIFPASFSETIFTADAGTLHHRVLADLAPPSGPVVLGIANAASYAAGPVAPGEIVTIYGTGMGDAALTAGGLTPAGQIATSAAGTSVTFDGKLAPLLYASAGQLSVIVPYGISGTTQVQVAYNGTGSAPFTMPVGEASPALFTINSAGYGQAAVLNQDGSANSQNNPAAPGSIVVLFGTGEGATDPMGTDGQFAATVYPKPLAFVAVTVGVQGAEVLYAGAAPGQVAGLFQLNVRIPPTSPFGAVPVVVTVGSVSSPRGTVTLSVR